MFKITIIGITKSLFRQVETVGKIEYIDQYCYSFAASFDGCEVKVKGERVFIRNPEKRAALFLNRNEFKEITIV